MGREIFVSSKDGRVSVATTVDGKLYYLDEQNDNAKVGNIYVGKVVAVQKNIQAAFVDIGSGVNAYLSINEKSEIKVGQEILVRVKRDEIGDKGCKLTTDITLPGKYVALVFEKPEIRVSKKIVNREIRATLKELVKKAFETENGGNVFGAIIRTEAEQIPIELLLSELYEQMEAANQLLKAAEKGTVPRLIFNANDIVFNVLRDNLDDDLEKIVVDDLEIFKKIEQIIKAVYPKALSRLSLYTNEYDMFDFYKLSVEISRSKLRSVWLDSGAYLVIDKTEAMNVIDVNTGKFEGSKGKEESFLQVNLEATAEIVRQITLRHLRGILIVDFINLKKEESQQQLLECFNMELKKFSRGSEALGLTKLGLMEVRI